MPKSILFWRALTQWVGGLGILTMFLAVSTRVEGTHQLFSAEGHKIEVDRPVPGLANTIRIFLGVYALFTAVIILGLYAFGMPFFDSVCRSFAALATGGFSPYDASIDPQPKKLVYPPNFDFRFRRILLTFVFRYRWRYCRRYFGSMG